MRADRIVVATLPVTRQNFHRPTRSLSDRVARLQATAEVSLRGRRQSSTNHAIQTSQFPNLPRGSMKPRCDRVFLPLQRATHLPADLLPLEAGYEATPETCLSTGFF